jgi:drug/metabolite transporter (DMT)-like permease
LDRSSGRTARPVPQLAPARHSGYAGRLGEHVLLGELAGIASAAIWAVTSLALVEPARRIPSVTVSAIRLLGSMIFYVLLVLVAGKAGDLTQIGGGRLIGLLLSAVLGFGIGDTLYIAGQHRAGVSVASPLSVTIFPVLTITFAWALLGSTLSAQALGGGALTLVGILLILARPGEKRTRADMLLEATLTPEPDSTGGAITAPPRRAGPRALNWPGIAMVAGATLAWALSSVWVQNLTQGENVIVVNTLRGPAVLLAVGGFALAHGDAAAARRLARRDWLIVGLAGAIGTGVSSLAYIYAVQQAGAGLTALLNSLSPVLALPLAVLWLKERVTPLMAAGTALSLAGVWLVLA